MNHLPAEAAQLLKTLLDTRAKVEVVARLRCATEPMLLADVQSRSADDGGAICNALTELVRDHVVLVSSSPSPTLHLSPRARTAAFESLMKVYVEEPSVVTTALHGAKRDAETPRRVR